VLGSLFFGATSLGAGFLNNRIALLVLRALQGIGASHTIPSALSMIVQMLPDPKQQQRAIGLFGASGAIANGEQFLKTVQRRRSSHHSVVLGTIIGAILVQYASWRWIFWLIAMLSIPAATACIFLIPKSSGRKDAKASQLDVLGIFILIGMSTLWSDVFTETNCSPH
jgi:MFS family permease